MTGAMTGLFDTTLLDSPALAGSVVGVVPLQQLAYRLALLHGNDVDRPRNLAKTVTVE